MQAQPSLSNLTPAPSGESPYPRLSGDEAVAVVDGYGVSLRVARGYLVIRDGLGRHGRERRFARATCPLRRVLILGHSGTLSLEAIRWCADVGVHVAHLDWDGRVLITSARRDTAAARIRRVQALAGLTSLGSEITAYLLGEKIAGQASVALNLPGGADLARAIHARADAARDASSIDFALDAEALAAQDYWAALAALPMRFARRDADGVPEHWKFVGLRVSPRSGDKRKAITPAHAIFNYIYRLLEVETTIALHGAGLDPSLGFFHRDERYRDSLALDVMEAGRPVVDEILVRMLRERAFAARAFHENPDGVVRILPPLTHELAALMPQLGRAIEPVTISVARLLDREPNLGGAAIAFRKARRSEHKRATTRREPPTKLARTCHGCGQAMKLGRGQKQRYCDDCREQGRAQAFAAFVSKGRPDTLAALAEIGDPSHDAETSKKRQAALSLRGQERRAWNETNAGAPWPDPDDFRREVTPKLVGLTVSEISRATGLSRRYCKRVRDEGLVPHASRWDGFRSLGRH